MQKQARDVLRQPAARSKQLDFSRRAGFLDAADFDLLFAPGSTEEDLPTDSTAAIKRRNERSREPGSCKRATGLRRPFCPSCKQRLIRQFIVQTMTAHTGADPVLVEACSPTSGCWLAPKPLLDAFAATGERGLTADFFDFGDGSGVRQLTTLSLTDADTALKARGQEWQSAQACGANSARFEGYLEVPAPARTVSTSSWTNRTPRPSSASTICLTLFLKGAAGSRSCQCSATSRGVPGTEGRGFPIASRSI